jgi:hypothetical protein
MALPPGLFALTWQEAQEQMDAFNAKVPEYLAKVGVPTLEVMPDLNIPAYFAVFLGVIAVLVALMRLFRLRIFRFVFALIAAALILYYPGAYGFHWFLFKYDAEAKAARAEDQVPQWEKFSRDNLRYLDWGIMGAGVLLGGTLLLMTRPPKRRWEDEAEEQQQQQAEAPAPWHQEQAQAPRQSSRQPGRGQKPSRDPFDFS